MNSKKKKTVLVLLAGHLWNDSRVLKISHSLSKQYYVTVLCYSGGTPFPVPFKVIEIPKKNNIVNRFLERTYFWKPFQRTVANFIKTIEYVDIVWANDLNTLYTASFICDKKNAKLIYDSHEIYVETINQFFPPGTTGIKKIFHTLNCGFMRKVGKRMESTYGSKADFIFAANDSFRDVLISRYHWDHIASLYNLPLYNESERNEKSKRLIDNFPPSDIIVLYHGVLNAGRGLELLLSAMTLLPEKYHLVILGSGFLLNHLQELTKQKDIESRVTFLPMVPEKELIDYIRGAKIGINLLEKVNISKWLASTNKLFQYLHAGIPAVCSKAPENMKVLSNDNVGIAVDNDPFEVAKGIKYLYDHQNDYTTEYLHEIAKKYIWSRNERILIEKLNEISL